MVTKSKVSSKENSFDLLGKRWTALIVKDLMQGPRRFRELLNDIGRINDKVLSQRLKELEEQGIIDRKVYAEVPVRVVYTLTERGRALAGVINAMQDWDGGSAKVAPAPVVAEKYESPTLHIVPPAEPMVEAPAAEAPMAVAASHEPVAAASFAPAHVESHEPVAQPQAEAAAPSSAPAHMGDKAGHKPFWRRLGL